MEKLVCFFIASDIEPNPSPTEVTRKVFIDIVYDYPGIHSDGWGGMGTKDRSRWEIPIKIQRGDSN